MSVGKIDFVERRHLWTDEQKEAAEQVKRTIDEKRLATFRVSSVTSTASSGAKTLTAHDFLRALQKGDRLSDGEPVHGHCQQLVHPDVRHGAGIEMAELVGAPDSILLLDPMTWSSPERPVKALA
jgi:glutamine synthetase